MNIHCRDCSLRGSIGTEYGVLRPDGSVMEDVRGLREAREMAEHLGRVLVCRVVIRQEWKPLQ